MSNYFNFKQIYWHSCKCKLLIKSCSTGKCTEESPCRVGSAFHPLWKEPLNECGVAAMPHATSNCVPFFMMEWKLKMIYLRKHSSLFLNYLCRIERKYTWIVPSADLIVFLWKIFVSLRMRVIQSFIIIRGWKFCLDEPINSNVLHHNHSLLWLRMQSGTAV